MVLGLASSHAPTMFVELEEWEELHQKLVKDVPQPLELQQESLEFRASCKERIQKAFSDLRNQLEAAKPDVLVIVGDDQNELFGPSCQPSLAIFVGEEAKGSPLVHRTGRVAEGDELLIKCHSQFAIHLANELVKQEFDVSVVHELVPQGRLEKGLGHAFSRIAGIMELEQLDIPAVLVFLNAYNPPLPTAKRCYDLGQAIAAITRQNSERVAIYGSGGLSHDPTGPRAGWIDEPLDRWVLEAIASGQAHRLKEMFIVDSDTMHGGTGEIRSWITTAGAFEGVAATVVDYIPLRHAVTGLGFASWNPSNTVGSRTE